MICSASRRRDRGATSGIRGQSYILKKKRNFSRKGGKKMAPPRTTKLSAKDDETGVWFFPKKKDSIVTGRTKRWVFKGKKGKMSPGG